VFLSREKEQCSSPAGSSVGQHADHDPVRIANKEATDAPRLVNRSVDDLVPGFDCCSMRRIDGCSRIDVHANGREQGFYAWRRKDDLRLAGSSSSFAEFREAHADQVPHD
jgi:hypothetical protein